MNKKEVIKEVVQKFDESGFTTSDTFTNKEIVYNDQHPDGYIEVNKIFGKDTSKVNTYNDEGVVIKSVETEMSFDNQGNKNKDFTKKTVKVMDCFGRVVKEELYTDDRKTPNETRFNHYYGDDNIVEKEKIKYPQTVDTKFYDTKSRLVRVLSKTYGKTQEVETYLAKYNDADKLVYCWNGHELAETEYTYGPDRKVLKEVTVIKDSRAHNARIIDTIIRTYNDNGQLLKMYENGFLVTECKYNTGNKMVYYYDIDDGKNETSTFEYSTEEDGTEVVKETRNITVKDKIETDVSVRRYRYIIPGDEKSRRLITETHSSNGEVFEYEYVVRYNEIHPKKTVSKLPNKDSKLTVYLDRTYYYGEPLCSETVPDFPFHGDKDNICTVTNYYNIETGKLRTHVVTCNTTDNDEHRFKSVHTFYDE